MNQNINTIKNIEGAGSVDIVNPVSVEGLLRNDLLPKDITSSSELIDQASQRLSLLSTLKNLFEKENPTEDELTLIYIQLSDFLELDINNCRILLYFPLNLLPDLNIVSESENLNAIKVKLQSLIEISFIKLLHERDIRANFIDGDVLEPALGIPERVRKIAHLVPEFVSKNLISPNLLIELLEVTNDTELIKSLLEGFLVGSFNGIIEDSYLERVMLIAKTNESVNSILNSLLNKTKEVSIQIEVPRSLSELVLDLEKDLTDLENTYSPESEYALTISETRAKWEKQTKGAQIMENAANIIADKLIANTIQIAEIVEFSKLEGFNNAYKIVALKSVFSAIERLSYINFSGAQSLFETFKDFIETSAFNAQSEVKDSIITGLNYLARLNIINEDYLHLYNLQLLDLGSAQPIESENLVQKDFRVLAIAAKKVEQHPILSRYIYPVFIGFGSRLKAYGLSNSDIDAAILFKPETPWEKRSELLALLRQDVAELNVIDKILEFWVYNDNGKLRFRDVPKAETIVGPSEIHILMNGLWVGNANEYNQLYSNLIERYFNLDRLGEQKEEVRTHLLRQLEMDILQCRLMHKGYRRFYPSSKPVQSQYAGLIDYKSDFWDKGYRKVATQLFLGKVFLPDIETRVISN